MAKSKDLQPRLLYSPGLSFKIEGEIKGFQDKKKLKEFVTTKPVLQFFNFLLLYSITVVPIIPLCPPLPIPPPTPTNNSHTIVHVHRSFMHVLILSPSFHHSSLSPFPWQPPVCFLFPSLETDSGSV